MATLRKGGFGGCCVSLFTRKLNGLILLLLDLHFLLRVADPPLVGVNAETFERTDTGRRLIFEVAVVRFTF